VRRAIAGLPAGMVEAAVRWRSIAATVVGGEVPDQAVVERELVLPLATEPAWPGPSAPMAVPGGWVQADLIDDDRDTFDRLRRTHPEAGPETLAELAQQLRLPVLPYRTRPWPAPPAATSGPARHDGNLAGRTVIDLTSLWAGPLATRLLAEAGAEVIKIDPACRPDGFRVWPRLYDALNGAKQVIDLDLRVGDHRAAFESLVGEADLLVSSLSRRVLPNLGYDHAALRTLQPRLGTLDIVGFPVGCPEQDWLAYGTGVHAISGRGMVDGRPRPTPVAYPDGLAGHAGFVRALELLGTGDHGEVSLIESLAAAPSTARTTPR